MHPIRTLFNVLWTVLCLLCVGSAAAAPTDLSQQSWVLEDPDGRLQIDAVRSPLFAHRFTRQHPNPGFSTAAHWIRIDIASADNAVYWLDTGNRTVQEADVYVIAPDGQIRHMEAGSRFPFSHRPLLTDNFVFPIAVQAGQPVQVYLRVRSTGYQHIAMHLSLWRPAEFEARQRSESMQWSAYLGMAAALAIVNLMLWAYLRDINHLNYVLSLFAVALAVCCNVGGYGSAFREFWPDWPVFAQITWSGSVALSVVFPCMFISRLIDAPNAVPRTWRAVVLTAGVTTALIAAELTATAFPAIFPASASTLQRINLFGIIAYSPLLPLMLAAVYMVARQGNRAARFVMVAYLPVSFAAIYCTWQASQGHAMPLVYIMWASAFELFVTALALADKVYRKHLQMLEARQAKVDALRRSEQELEQRVLQRTGELQREQSRTRELLYNILPMELVDELEKKGRAAPARHESATVLFTDFAGFTNAAATMPADRMIAELNEIFAAFDDITDECGVEKIKTIGDAYMAAAGLPKACPDHAQRCVRAGLKMVAYIEQRNRTATFKWMLRVGIHSGPVVAGVVGKRKYAFDIWGDTVNIASRMESSGEAGKVNVSAYTSDLAREHFNCEYRGKVAAKGKGDIDMYFVVGERALAPQPCAVSAG